MTQEITASTGKLFVTVNTVDGRGTIHEYDTPSSEKPFMAQLGDTFREVSEALSGKRRMFTLANPWAVYNASHVVKIEFRGVGSAEFERAVEQPQRTMGFLSASAS